jgi:hypothetical protein
MIACKAIYQVFFVKFVARTAFNESTKNPKTHFALANPRILFWATKKTAKHPEGQEGVSAEMVLLLPSVRQSDKFDKVPAGNLHFYVFSGSFLSQ